MPGSNIILAFESSCDDTCCAVLRNGVTLSNVISSQIDIHKLYGGVVPEIASRNHAMAILGVAREAITQAEVTLADVTEVAGTTEPGLRGAVMCGQIFAESLAHALNVPFCPVNHLAAHIVSPLCARKSIAAAPKFPILSLLVSGGHTALYLVRAWSDIQLVTQTADDAIGEAFDKVAKILGLPYPGGVRIEALAREYCGGDHVKFVQKPSKKESFSFSGLKTAVLSYLSKATERDLPFICASFQREATAQLTSIIIKYLAQNPSIKTLFVGGGVSANQYIRATITDAIAPYGVSVYFPQPEFCTDNAAMVALAAYFGAEM